jgi:nucleoside 2-deoxyribosyltransferase
MSNREMVRVYIASPYTVGDQALNVRRQIDCFQDLVSEGFVPFAPLVTHFIHMIHPMSYEEWMKYDFAWIQQCDCVLRLEGHSPGADREVEFAKHLGINVFYSIDEIIKAYEGSRRQG